MRMSCVPQCTGLTLQWVTHAAQIVKMVVLILQKAIRHYVHSELYKRLYSQVLKEGPFNKLTNRLQTILSIRVRDKQSRAKQQGRGQACNTCDERINPSLINQERSQSPNPPPLSLSLVEPKIHPRTPQYHPSITCPPHRLKHFYQQITLQMVISISRVIILDYYCLLLINNF